MKLNVFRVRVGAIRGLCVPTAILALGCYRVEAGPVIAQDPTDVQATATAVGTFDSVPIEVTAIPVDQAADATVADVAEAKFEPSASVMLDAAAPDTPVRLDGGDIGDVTLDPAQVLGNTFDLGNAVAVGDPTPIGLDPIAPQDVPASDPGGSIGAVPEPSSVVLTGSGLFLGIAAAVRSRRKARSAA